MNKKIILFSILVILFLGAWMIDSLIYNTKKVEGGFLGGITVCTMDHKRPISTVGIPDPRGTIIAGVTMFSDYLKMADEHGVSEEDKEAIQILAEKYENEAREQFMELSKILYPLHAYHLLREEIEEIREKARGVADKLDDLYVNTYFEAKPYLLKEPTSKYNEWFGSIHPLYPDKIFTPEELEELDRKYSKQWNPGNFDSGVEIDYHPVYGKVSLSDYPYSNKKGLEGLVESFKIVVLDPNKIISITKVELNGIYLVGHLAPNGEVFKVLHKLDNEPAAKIILASDNSSNGSHVEKYTIMVLDICSNIIDDLITYAEPDGTSTGH